MAPEFEKAKEAFFTDPDDQSVWIYHRWLVGRGNVFLLVFYALLLILRKLDPSKELLEREIASIQELVEEEPNKKCMSDDLTMRLSYL